jgi:hypothetical protein
MGNILLYFNFRIDWKRNYLFCDCEQSICVTVDLGMAVSMTLSIPRTCVASGCWSSSRIRVLRGHQGIRGRSVSYHSASKNLAPNSQPISSSLLNIQPMSSRLIIQPMSNSGVRTSSQLVSWMGQGLNMGLHGGRRQDDREDVVI